MPTTFAPELNEDQHPPVNAWVLAVIGFGQRRSRVMSITVVLGLLSLIGWVDYITGTRVSLGLFYLLPIILSALWLGWAWGCGLSVASIVVRVGGDLIYGGDQTTPISIFWNRLSFLIVYLIIVWVLHALTSLQRHLERRVERRTAALARALQARDELQRQLVESARGERNRIGHELHDGLGQHLTATSLALKMLSNELESAKNPAAAEAQAALRMTQDCIAQTRQLARGLLLAAVAPDQLTSELEELCGTIQRENHISCVFSCTADPAGLNVESASHIFYIAHEAVRNALRHAQATRIEVRLEKINNTLELSVTDDGLGPPPPDAKLTGMGLRIMAHRSELIGGKFAIRPGDQRGAKVTCSLAFSTVAA